MKLDKKTAATVAEIRERNAIREYNRRRNAPDRPAKPKRERREPAAQDDLALLLDIVARYL